MSLRYEERCLLEIANEIIYAHIHNEAVDLHTINFTELDWPFFNRLMKKHKVYLLYFPYIEKFIPNEFIEEMHSYYSLKKKTIDSFIQELSTVISFAEQNGIQIMIMKGLALSLFIYDNLYQREFNDLDVFICNHGKRTATANFKDLLVYNLGYKHIIAGREAPIHTDELGIFHEYELYKEDSYGVPIYLEIKNASSAIDESIIDDFLLIENLQMVEASGICILTNNISYTLLHLFSNIYGDTEKRIGVERKNLLRDLIDISLLIYKYKSAIDWGEISFLSKKYNVSYKIYNVLDRLRKMNLIDEILGEDIISIFKPIELKANYIDSIGGKVSWSEHGVAERLFDVKGRLAEYSKLQYYKNLSEFNSNYDQRMVLGEMYTCWNEVSPKVFTGQDVFYSMAIDNKNKRIKIGLKLPKAVIIQFPYVICFSFYNGGRPYFIYIDVDKEKNYYSISTPEDRTAGKKKEELEKIKCTCIDVGDEIIVESYISLKSLGNALRKGLLCYNVVVHKYIFEYIRTIVDVMFCEKNDPEEWYDHMGVIQYE